MPTTADMIEGFVLVGILALGAFFLFGRRGGTRKTPSVNPRQLTETLDWRDGETSPNGRRVLWVQPAARTLHSLTESAESAAFFAAGCPVNIEELA